MVIKYITPRGFTAIAQSEFFAHVRDPCPFPFASHLAFLLSFTGALLFPFPRFLPASSVHFAADKYTVHRSIYLYLGDHYDKPRVIFSLRHSIEYLFISIFPNYPFLLYLKSKQDSHNGCERKNP